MTAIILLYANVLLLRANAVTERKREIDKDIVPALSNDNLVALRNTVECRGTMDGDVLVTFFITLVFADEMEVITTNGDGALHLDIADNACVTKMWKARRKQQLSTFCQQRKRNKKIAYL